MSGLQDQDFTNDVHRESVETIYVLQEEFCSLSGGMELGESRQVNRLGEPVHKGEDDSVPIRRRQTSEEIHCNVQPRATRDA